MGTPWIWGILCEFQLTHWHYSDVIMTTIASLITSLAVVYSAVYSDADQRKHQSSASLAFVWGIHRDRWIPRTKGQLRGKCFHLMTSSCKIYVLFQLLQCSTQCHMILGHVIMAPQNIIYIITWLTMYVCVYVLNCINCRCRVTHICISKLGHHHPN